jgi:hypothetical protein
MRAVRRFGLAAAAAVVFGVAVGPAEALVQSWDPNLVAYSYVYYADAEKTQMLGYAFDRCVMSGNTVYVAHPYIPTPYYDQTPEYVCSEMGPYLPPDW